MYLNKVEKKIKSLTGKCKIIYFADSLSVLALIKGVRL